MSAGLMTQGRAALLVLAAPALLLVSACGSDDSVADGSAEVELDETVLALLRDDDTLGTTASLVERTGLAEVLDAAPSYTLLAPTDTALAALAPAEGDEVQDTAAMAALLRGHLLPGYVTFDDITAAIAASEGGSVTMQTMAQTPVTFTGEGDTVTVTAADGASATLAGPGKSGGNGVILPVDGILKTL